MATAAAGLVELPVVVEAPSAPAIEAGAANAVSVVDAERPAPVVRTIGFDSDRSAFVVLPTDTARPARLLAMLHGVCVPPSYVCGGWKRTAADVGVLVCPTGNATCREGGMGGPTWEEPFSAMDTDLEHAIASTRRRIAPTVSREGSILAGFSRGAYVAVILAVRHPGRWPFLVLNEAEVELTVPMLRGAGVRAVALVAGEWSAQIASERKTADELAAQGYPARLWVMPKVGHAYSADIESIMREAVDYLLQFDVPPPPSP